MAKNRKTPDMNLPMWFDGQNINEALFCEEFLHERRIIFANGAFFTPIPPRLFKETVHLNRLKEQIMAILNDTHPPKRRRWRGSWTSCIVWWMPCLRRFCRRQSGRRCIRRRKDEENKDIKEAGFIWR